MGEDAAAFGCGLTSKTFNSKASTKQVGAFLRLETKMKKPGEMKPLWGEAHCPSCVFLGHIGGCDMYFCPQGGVLPTVIVRFSSVASEYTSGLALAEAMTLQGLDEHKIPADNGIYALRIAYLIARDLGLVKDRLK